MSLVVKEKDPTQVWVYSHYVVDTNNETLIIYEGFSYANCQKYIELIEHMK